VKSYHANLGAGIDGVAALGAGVSRDFSVGDRVSAAIFPRWIDGRFDLDVADQLGGSHAIEPVIDRVFAFADAVEAYRCYETSKPFGKVVIAHP
jgi:Zinc-binding dehydrogenase